MLSSIVTVNHFSLPIDKHHVLTNISVIHLLSISSRHFCSSSFLISFKILPCGVYHHNLYLKPGPWLKIKFHFFFPPHVAGTSYTTSSKKIVNWFFFTQSSPLHCHCQSYPDKPFLNAENSEAQCSWWAEGERKEGRNLFLGLEGRNSNWGEKNHHRILLSPVPDI